MSLKFKYYLEYRQFSKIILENQYIGTEIEKIRIKK